MNITTNIHHVTGIKIRRYELGPDDARYPNIDVTFVTDEGDMEIAALRVSATCTVEVE